MGVGKGQLGKGAQKVQGFCGQVPTRGEISSGRRSVVEHQELPVTRCEVTFRPSTPGSTRWLCQSTFVTNEGKNASIILNARLHL